MFLANQNQGRGAGLHLLEAPGRGGDLSASRGAHIPWLLAASPPAVLRHPMAFPCVKPPCLPLQEPCVYTGPPETPPSSIQLSQSQPQGLLEGDNMLGSGHWDVGVFEGCCQAHCHPRVSPASPWPLHCGPDPSLPARNPPAWPPDLLTSGLRCSCACLDHSSRVSPRTGTLSP